MFANQKSQEISYALIRISLPIRRQELRQRIERLSFQLLEDVASEDFEFSLKTIARLEVLIGLGKSIYEIEPVNAKVIIGELNSLKSEIRQIVGFGSDIDESPKLDQIFSKVPAVLQSEIESADSANNAAIMEDTGNVSGNGMASTIRQSAILEKIRQSQNRQAQLKDIIASFPEVSERTMRYDLQKLCSQGLIERVGNGGPGSYYSLKP